MMEICRSFEVVSNTKHDATSEERPKDHRFLTMVTRKDRRVTARTDLRKHGGVLGFFKRAEILEMEVRTHDRPLVRR